MPECDLKKAFHRHEEDHPARYCPGNRAQALSFTLHDLALQMFQFSTEPQGPMREVHVHQVLDQIQAQINSYRLMQPIENPVASGEDK